MNGNVGTTSARRVAAGVLLAASGLVAFGGTRAQAQAVNADLSITKTDGAVTATAGAAVVYTIVVSNAGPAAVADATVTDTFPATLTASWTCAGTSGAGSSCAASGTGNISDSTVDLPSGGSVTYTVTATLSSNATGTLVNTATVAPPAGVTDPTPANNTATDTDTVAVSADLSVTKTGPVGGTAGADAVYTIAVMNNGPSDATSALLTDVLPAGVTFVSVSQGAAQPVATLLTPAAGGTGPVTASWASFPAGASATLTLTVNVGSSFAGDLANTATVDSSTADPNPVNDTSSFTFAVAPTTTTTTTTTTTLPTTTTTSIGSTTTTTITGVIPATGGNSAGFGIAAIALLGGGALLIALARRREHPRTSG